MHLLSSSDVTADLFEHQVQSGPVASAVLLELDRPMLGPLERGPHPGNGPRCLGAHTGMSSAGSHYGTPSYLLLKSCLILSPESTMIPMYSAYLSNTTGLIPFV